MTPEQESVLAAAIKWYRSRTGRFTFSEEQAYRDACTALESAVTRMQSAPGSAGQCIDGGNMG